MRSLKITKIILIDFHQRNMQCFRENGQNYFLPSILIKSSAHNRDCSGYCPRVWFIRQQVGYGNSQKVAVPIGLQRLPRKKMRRANTAIWWWSHLKIILPEHYLTCVPLYIFIWIWILIWGNSHSTWFSFCMMPIQHRYYSIHSSAYGPTHHIYFYLDGILLL